MKQGLVAPTSKPGNLRAHANGGFWSWVLGFPGAHREGSHDAFLGEILIVHFQAGKVLAQTQQMEDGGGRGDAACPRTGYPR